MLEAALIANLEQAPIYFGVVKMSQEFHIEVLADDRLINPRGLEIGSEGDVYTSNKSFTGGQGEVRQLKPNTFSPDPIYDQVKHYTTTIAADGDPADVYYPVLLNSTPDQLPIVLMLQGAFVDKADYSNYAETVARYGFVVVVPNNQRTLTVPGATVTGLLSPLHQVQSASSVSALFGQMLYSHRIWQLTSE